MLPILYRGDETSFVTNGLGRLTEIISCIVTEERNGVYEVEFEYPITGKFYTQMISMIEAYSIGDYANSGIIGCIHDDYHDVQPFDIYGVSAPIDGIATFNAHHISYRLGGMVAAPFSATSAADAITVLPLRIAGDNPFTFWTDKGSDGSFSIDHPENVRGLLGGEEGSFLDVFGTGEYKFDKFLVRLYQKRGINSGITIRYGKNLTNAERELDSSGRFNAIAPYWIGTETDTETGESYDAIVYLSDIFVKAPGIEGSTVVQAMDFSGEFQEIPTQDELRAVAVQYLTKNTPWVPDDNITVSFVQLWQTTEYENVAALQRLSLCDHVTVYYTDLGIIAEDQEIVKVVYNVMTERYDSMEIGKLQTSLADAITNNAIADFRESQNEQVLTASMMETAINHATDLLRGGLGGHVVFTPNADGQPQEILIMDTDDVNTAQQVIRMNKNGIGFSSTGYQGPFRSAWTIDGTFNADFITAGTMSANRLLGGTLKLGGGDNGNGVMRVYNASNSEIATLDKTGFRIYATNNGIPYTIGLSERGLYFKRNTSVNDDLGFTFSSSSDGVVSAIENTSGSIEMNSKSTLITANTVNSGILIYRPTTTWYPMGNSHPDVYLPINNYYNVIRVNGTTVIEASPFIVTGTEYTSGTTVYGNLQVTGTKNRLVETEDYGKRLLYSYETPSPMFGDIGDSVVGDDGYVYIFLDSIFAESIDTETSYQVFLQKYGEGDCYISERNPNYFVVKGTPGLSFGWELKAKQRDYSQERLAKYDANFIYTELVIDYASDAADYIEKLEEGRMAI